jgi:hypothetical protein
MGSRVSSARTWSPVVGLGVLCTLQLLPTWHMQASSRAQFEFVLQLMADVGKCTNIIDDTLAIVPRTALPIRSLAHIRHTNLRQARQGSKMQASGIERLKRVFQRMRRTPFCS